MSTTKSRKRKQPQRVRRAQPVPLEDREAPFQPDSTLFTQAHEADISRGPQAHALALSLEVSSYEDNGKLRVKAGDGLIRWQGAAHQRNSEFEGDEEEVVSLGRTHTHEKPHNEDDEAIWVDRYASPATRVL